MVTQEYFTELLVSAVYDGCFISFDRKIKLNEDKTKVIFA